MDDATEEALLIGALRTVIDPELGVDIVQLGLVRRIDADDLRVQVTIVPTSPSCPVTELMQRDAERALRRVAGDRVVDVRIEGAAEGGVGDRSSLPPLLTRGPFLLPAAASLVIGLAVGLRWMGIDVSSPAPQAHAPLMLVGFLGTLIALERAVALGLPALYGAPVLLGAGTLASVFVASDSGRVAALLGSLLFVVASGIALKRKPEPFAWMLSLGAVALAVGTALWLAERPRADALLWWLLFPILTIAGERLELSAHRGPAAGLLASAGVLVAAALVAPWAPELATRGFGVGLIALAAWLLRHDVARETLGRAGLPRFVAVCLLLGYAWLVVAGLILAIGGAQAGGLLYDAGLHAILLGFVFGMIFGHAPVIFPALFAVEIPFRPRFWLHLGLLEASLVVRVGGDLAGLVELRLAGGLLGVLAIALFALSTAAAVRRRSGG